MLDFFKAVPSQRKVKIKHKEGIIYHNPPFIKKCLFYVGCFMLLASVTYLSYLYWPLSRALIISKYIPKDPVILPVIEEQIKANETNPDDFYIHIPKIGADAKVVEGVDPYRKEEYLKVLSQDEVALSNLSKAPGQGKGSTSYIFAHSTQQGLAIVRNNAVFYLLGDLTNDDVVLVNYHGEIFKYKVYEKKVISVRDIEYLRYRDEDKELLILQTCWPIGTDWKRLLVFAERI